MSFQQDTQSANTVTVFRLVSAIAVAIAATSVFLWRVRRPGPVQATRDPKPCALAPRTALASLYPSPSRTGAPSEPIPEEAPHDVVRLQGPDGKTSRSKERRRRGKDLLKELSKGGKRHKELLRQSNRHPATSLGDPTSLQAEQGLLHPERSPLKPKSNESSRVQASGPPQLRECTPSHLDAVNTPRTPIDKPSDDTVSRSTAGKLDPSARPVEDPSPSHNNDGVSPSQDRSCNASTDHLLAAPSLGQGSHTERCSSSSNTSSPSQGRPHSGVTSGSCDRDGQSSVCQESTPRFTAAVRATKPRSGLGPPATDIFPTLSDISSSTPLTCPAPALRLGTLRTPTSHVPPNPVSAQTQIASLRGALEAARLREEKSRMEAECRAKEYDALRRRWMEETARRQHREAQLHAYIQYLTHVLQMYAGAYPSLSTSVPIVPALAASPLPGAVHSITMHQSHNYNTVLRNTRGRRRKREVQDDEVFRNPDMDVLPLCNEIVGAILKRPESLRAEIQPSLPRSPSLPDMGHLWYAGGTNTSNENDAAAEDGGENEALCG